MKDLMGCLLLLIGIPVVVWVGYMLFHIILYFLPLVVVGAIILALPYLAYQFWKGVKS